jgi:hypothetical protein
MTERIVKPLPFFVAVKEIAIFYVQIFKHILGLVALAALLQAFVSLLVPENPTVGLAVSLLGSLVSMFLYAWILYRADSVLMNRSETTHHALRVAKKTFLPLIGVLAVYLVLMIVLALFGFGMQMLGKLIHLTLLLTIATLGLVLFVLTLIAFTMPAVVLDRFPIFKSFEYSIRLVWRNWWRTFGIILIFVIPVGLLSLLIPLLPPRGNLAFITFYEFVYHMITYPLMISLILILYHDLKTRHHVEGFKHMQHAAVKTKD